MENQDEVLSSETRKNILKLLAEKNHRPVDLSNALGKDRSTITEHLAILKNAGFVEKIERKGYKWIFYTLSQNAYTYFPNRTKHTILFVLSILALTSSIISFMAGSIQQNGKNEITDNFTKVMAAEKSLAIDSDEVAQNYTSTLEIKTTKENHIYVTALLFSLFMFFAILFVLTKKTEFVVPKKK